MLGVKFATAVPADAGKGHGSMPRIPPLSSPSCTNTTIKTKCCDNSGFCIEPAAAAARLTIRISKWRRRATKIVREGGREEEREREKSKQTGG